MLARQRFRQLVPAVLIVSVLALSGVAGAWARSHSLAGSAAAVAERANGMQQKVTARGAGPSLGQAPAAAPTPSETSTRPPDPTSAAPTPTMPPATPTVTLTPAPLLPSATPTPAATPRPTLPFTYTVRSGDTLWDLSIQFRIDVDSLVWANERLEEDRDALQIGQVLVVPPVVGALHIVAPGDTLSTIAVYYKVALETITGYAANSLQPPYALRVGQVLMVPGGIKPLLTRWVTTDKGTMTVNAPASQGRFGWPTAGLITQYFSRNHLGIDIANREGAPVLAAANGTVIFAGEKAGGFGLAVTIDNGDGYSTQYAHLRAFSVAAGDQVARGQQIGEMGNTGQSTGPHLDFRIYYLGGAINPIHYLP